MSRLLRSFGSLVALVALVAGTPYLLVTKIGWPLPSEVPDLGTVLNSIERTGVSVATVIDALAVLLWVTWARVAIAVLIEVAAALLRRPAPQLRGLGSAQRLAASLLMSLILVTTLVGGSRGVSARPAIPSTLDASSSASSWSLTQIARSVAVADDEPVEHPSDPAVSAATWTVRRNDSLWRIAEESLGDGSRWRDIATANLGREVAPGVIFDHPDTVIHPGWVLALPELPTVSQPVAPGDQLVRVEPGDTLTQLAAETLGDAAQWPVLWHANEGRAFGSTRFDDPDRLLPGWELRVPFDGVLPVEQSIAAPAVPSATPAVRDATVYRVPSASPEDSCTAAPPTPSAAEPADIAAGPSDPTVEADPAPAVGPLLPLGPVAAVEDRSNGSRVPLGLGAATLVATGGISLIAARRRRRLQTAAPGSRLLPPTTALVDLERTLRAASADELVARLDLAVRTAFAQLGEVAHECSPYGAVTASDGSITLLFRGPTPVPAAPFEAVAHGWRIPGLVPTLDLPGGARFAPFPTPALAHVGATAVGDVWIDLEAVGALVIDGSTSRARGILRAIGAGLEVSPFADQLRLLRVTDPWSDLGDGVRGEAVPDLETAIELAADHLAPLLGVLRVGSTAAGMRSRSAGEPWEPVVVVVGAEHVPGSSVSDLAALGTPAGRGFGIVTDAGAFPADWRIRELDEGWRLEPVGLEVTPVGIDAGEAAAVAALLAEADRPLVVTSSADVSAEGTDPGPFVEPEWQFIVRTLGLPRVQTRAGATVEFSRSKSLELLSWLVRHRRAATRSGARAALWESEVADGTFANVVSEVRRTLAAAIEPPQDGEWLGRTLTEQLVLHAGVISDVELLEARLTHARRQPPAAARATLQGAIELISGTPFAGALYLWPDAEGFVSQDALLVADVATELARLCLADGDVDGVVRATAAGLVAVPGHEGLLGLRMRAHAVRGDRSAVKREWESYERTVAADVFGDGEPAPALLRLRKELLGAHRDDVAQLY